MRVRWSRSSTHTRTCRERISVIPVSEQTKARKDIAQARQVIEVLLTDRQDGIEAAVMGMQSRPKMRSRVRKELERLPAALVAHFVL